MTRPSTSVMTVPDIDIDALEAALDWTPLERAGDEDRGYCPFPENHRHGDSTGKFSINRSKRVWNCWVCGGGTLLSLIMRLKDLNEAEANAWIGMHSGNDEVHHGDFVAGISKSLDNIGEVEHNNATLPIFSEQRVASWAQNKHPWFTSRGIANGVQHSFNVGFDPKAIKYSKKPGEAPYTGPAIVLPHYWQGKLVGWQNRWLEADRPRFVQKYTNTSSFPKRHTVWGLDQALRATEPVVVVESVSTALFLISNGYPAVATFGAQVTEEQMKHLRVFHQGVLVAADNDNPGRVARKKLTEYLERFVPVWWVPLQEEEGADLGDLAPSGDGLAELIGGSILPV